MTSTLTLKAILFDLDDTLLDWSQNKITWDQGTRKHIQRVYQHLSTALQPQVTEEEFLKLFSHYRAEGWAQGHQTLIAPHVGNIIERLLGNYGITPNMDEIYSIYAWEAFPDVSVFPDAIEVLPRLQAYGLRLGLVTNAAHPIVLRERELVAFGLDKFLDVECRVCAADVGYLKPHPEIFRHALAKIGASPEEAVFVGDSYEADIVGAQAVGIKAILRRVSYRETCLEATDTAPDATIDTLHDLYPILDAWYPQWQDSRV